MQKYVDAAFKLYSGDKPFGIFVNKIEKNVAEMNRIADSIVQIFKDNKIENFDSLPKSKEDKQKFAKLFNAFFNFLELLVLS